MTIIGERAFSEADQEWFASVSGDRNPMHMDALAARRTMAGFPVVHGIHTLLWTLDCLFNTQPDLPAIASIKANFEKMVYLDDHVQAVLLHRTQERLRVEVTIGDATLVGLDVEFGAPRESDDSPPHEPMHTPSQPADLTFEQMVACAGQVPLPQGEAAIAAMYPNAARALGKRGLAALAASSFLVGMVCPGLHSIYRNLNLSVTPRTEGGLRFRVKHSDDDYRLIRLAIAGAGWTGLIDTFARPEPTAQADIARISKSIAHNAFADSRALVVGGSRGLGELVAKILAAGGAHVIVTYAVGETDARRVQSEIVGFGGRCDVMRYDVREDASHQLLGLAVVPTEMYYMATPMIFQRSGEGFSTERLQAFMTFYVTEFIDLCRVLRSHAGPDMGIFYPSSVSMDQRPASMTEYTMAKAAGEVLCADMQAFGKWRQVLVHRLPRLPTDQTATLYDDEAEDPIGVLQPIVLALQSGRRG